MVGDEVVELPDRLDPGPVGHRQSELGEAFAHEQLVLREPKRLGPGMHRHAGIDEGVQHVLGNVLVIERDHVDVTRELQHRGGVGVVADLPRGERRRHALGLGEHSELDSELDRRGNHHPGELPAADHSDPHPYTPSPRVRRPAARPVQSRARRHGIG